MLLPLIITIIGILYVISPIDILPDVIPVIGWSDDLFVIMIIIGSWALYFGYFVVQTLMPLIMLSLIVVGLVMLIKYLNKNKKKRR